MKMHLETIKTASQALSANKVRSALTMLGVVIGVSAVILLISIGRGVENYITDQFEALGSNLLFITPGKFEVGRDPGEAFTRNKLEEKHAELIETHAGDVLEVVTPYTQIADTVRYRNKSYLASVTGMDENSAEVFNYELSDGEYFSKSDVRSHARVAILGKLIAEEFFPNQDPIGQKIKISEDSYVVIGVLEEKGVNFDEQILVPYTSSLDTFGLSNISSIVMKVKDNEDIDRAVKQVERALLRDLKEDDFTVMSQKDILSSIQSILQMLTLGLGAIAGISLIVGGIGIMNIMLVSVTERTREIGLRKAVGATPNNIGLQFLFESTMLSVGGGIIGILIGWTLSLVARSFMRTEVPWWSVLLAFSFAAIVGIIFGTYPAVTASRKDPIEALRYE